MKFFCFCIAALTAINCAAAPAPVKKEFAPAEKRSFLDEMIKAGNPGGKKISSIRKTYDLIFSPMNIRTKMVVLCKAPNKRRVETYYPNGRMTLELFDGKNGWSVEPARGIVKIKPRQQTEIMDIQSRLALATTPLDAMFKEVKIESEPIEQDGKKIHRLICIWHAEDIPPFELSVGADDKLVYRVSSDINQGKTVVHSAGDVLSYKNFDGLIMPLYEKIQYTYPGGQTVSARSKMVECEINIPLDDRIFTPESEVKK